MRKFLTFRISLESELKCFVSSTYFKLDFDFVSALWSSVFQNKLNK